MAALPPVLVELRANAGEFLAAMGQAQAATARLGTEGASHAAKFGAASKIALAGLGIAAAGAAVESLKLASSFQSSMEQIHTQAGASQAEVNKMSKAVLGLAGATATAPEELAKGLFHLESAGLHGSRALSALRAAAEGAKIGHADLESVTNALNAAIVSGIPGVENMQQAMGALNGIVGSGDMRMQDLADALGTGVLAGVKQFGLSLNDVGAALATFGDNNIRGADAATQLRMAVLFMAKPAASAKDALDKIGMSTTQLADDMRSGGLIKAVGDLHDHLQAAGDTGAKAGQVILDAFGHKAGTGISILVDQYSRLTQKSAEVSAAAKNFQSDWDATTKTFQFRMEQVQAAAEAVGIVVGTFLMKAIDDAIGAFQTIAHAVEETVGFFERHRDVTIALASVTMTALTPAFIAASVAIGRMVAWNAAAFFLSVRATAMEAAGSLRAFGLAGLGAAGLVAALGFAVIDGVTHLTNLNGIVDDARKHLDSFRITSQTTAADVTKYFTDAAAQTQTSLQAFKDHLTSFSPGDYFSRALHPISTIEDAFNLGHVQAEMDKVTYAAIRSSSAIERVTEAMGQIPFNDNMNEMAKTMAAAGITAKDLSGDTATLVGKVKDYLAAQAASKNPSQAAAQDMRDIAGGAQTAADDVKKLKDAFDQLAGKAMSADEAAIQFRDNIRQLDAAVKASHGSLTKHTAASDAAASQFITTAKSALDLVTSMKDAHATNDQMRASLTHSIAALQATSDGSGFAKAQIDRLKAALALLGPAAADAGKKLKDAGKKARDAGVDFGTGFADGIDAADFAAMRSAAHLGTITYQALRNAIQAHSPSKLTAVAGADFVTGFVDAIDAGIAAAAAAATNLGRSAINALAAVAKAVDPKGGTLPDLIGGYAGARSGAVSAASSASIVLAHFQELSEHAAVLTARYNTLRAADLAAEAAARKHATALSNVAHEALRAAEALPTHTKAERAARAAAMDHARALEDEARAASQSASALVAADKAKEASLAKLSAAARATSATAKAAAQQADQAAKDAAAAAAQAAQALVTSVTDSVNQMVQAVQGFEATLTQGLTGDYSLSTLWQQLTTAGTATVADLQGNLDAILTRTKKFAADLKALVAAGADQNLIAQVAGMGPDAGDALATQLLAAGSDGIAALQDALGQIADVANAGAAQLAQSFYGPGVDAMSQFIAGLSSKFPELQAALAPLIAEVNSLFSAAGLAGPSSTASLFAQASAGVPVFAPGTGGGAALVTQASAPVNVQVTVQGSVVSQQDLIQAVAQGLNQAGNRGPVLLPSVT